MSRCIESLLAEAQDYWADGLPLPLDLAAKLIDEGVNVEALERNYLD